MKYLVVVFILVSVVFITQCTSSKKTAYEFPSAMAKPVQDGYRAQCEKGKVLYAINCAGCHNKKVKGRDVIPNFTAEQLKGYELRVLNKEHEEGIPESNVSAEEMGLINTFLMYRKKE